MLGLYSALKMGLTDALDHLVGETAGSRAAWAFSTGTSGFSPGDRPGSRRNLSDDFVAASEGAGRAAATGEIHTSYLLARVRASNLGSVTPIMVKGRPFNLIVLPMADGDPPKGALPVAVIQHYNRRSFQAGRRWRRISRRRVRPNCPGSESNRRKRTSFAPWSQGRYRSGRGLASWQILRHRRENTVLSLNFPEKGQRERNSQRDVLDHSGLRTRRSSSVTIRFRPMACAPLKNHATRRDLESVKSGKSQHQSG